MSDAPWLTIVGLGEDGPEGLPPASLAALQTAEIIMGPARHLGLIPEGPAEPVPWPVPFAEGIPQLLALRGRAVVVLASGDPFWFGAGTVIAKHLAPGEWRALPGPSCFSLAASRLGWALEATACLGLHAIPFDSLRPHLAPGARLIVTLRDGQAPAALAAYLTGAGFGDSQVTVFESLAGPQENQTAALARDLTASQPFQHPLCAAIQVAGEGPALPLATGREDAWFDHDGQITKRPVRALTLSALAPQPGEHLWDIGSGSGSVAIEWTLCHPTLTATAIEAQPGRADRIIANAQRLGAAPVTVIQGAAPDALHDLPRPDAIFVGGGLSQALIDHLTQTCPGARLVANAVTLESEALLASAQALHGGDLLRIELAQSAPLGPRRGWKAAYPIVQWCTVL